MTALLVCLGGGLGAALRLLLDGELQRRSRLGPWAIVVVNVVGSGVLGFLTARAAVAGWNPAVLSAAGTGVCGGFTTFSTASVTTIKLLRDGKHGQALGYSLGTLTLCLGACWLGYALG